MCAAAKGNKYALGLTTSGRPPIYDDPKDLEARIKKYFNQKNVKFTTTGLALFLGYASRQSLYDILKPQDEFAYIMKRALLTIENLYEEKLDSPSSSVAGSIFALSNMGWKNRQGVELSDPNGNPLPAPTQQINIGIDYSKLPTNVMDALLEARGPEQIEDAETTE